MAVQKEAWGIKRWVFGGNKRNNTEKSTKVEYSLTSIKNKKWTWAAHSMRRTNNRWTKKGNKRVATEKL